MRRPCWCTKQWQNVAQVLHNNRIKLPKDFFSLLLCTPTWPPWRHVKTENWVIDLSAFVHRTTRQFNYLRTITYHSVPFILNQVVHLHIDSRPRGSILRGTFLIQQAVWYPFRFTYSIHEVLRCLCIVKRWKVHVATRFNNRRCIHGYRSKEGSFVPLTEN